MDLLKLLTQTGTASTLIFLSFTGIAGVLIGKISIFKVKLGIAGVLFAGLAVGHFGATFDPHVLHFVKEFGLILFVYSIGLEVGPRFMSSLKSNGLKLNFFAIGIVLLGFITAIIIKVATGTPIEVVAGIMSGAVTNTPGLGAAQQVLTDQFPGAGLAEVTGMGYAVAYPFGIIGIILTMILVRVIFKFSIKNESEKYFKSISGISGKVEAINMKVENKNLWGKSIQFFKETINEEFVLSRVYRNNDFVILNEEDVILEGDIVYGVSTEENYKNLELKIGAINKTESVNITGKLGIRHVVFTNKKLAGKSIKEIGLYRRFPANITRIFRSGNELLPTENDTVEFGDTIRIVGERDKLSEVAKFLGNSVKELSHPNIIPIFIGILGGILIGSIPIAFPGLPSPAKLGLAGGPLLVALFLGHKGRIGKMDFYMTPGANLFIRELGIILFLACVGLSSGENFISTITDGGYIWMLYGAAITFIPLFVIGVIASILKFNYLSICGLLAGSMTDPPALEFANSVANTQAQSTAYATVYPVTMFLRVLLAQVLILIFL